MPAWTAARPWHGASNGCGYREPLNEGALARSIFGMSCASDGESVNFF
jgi:hypothetical protein